MTDAQEQGPGSQLTIPNELILADKAELPSLTPELINQLYEGGWGAVGLALHITDSQQRLMVAEHKVTPKNPTVAWGPITETVRWSKSKGKVESLLATAARCIHEELGFEDPEVAGLRDYGSHVWTVSRWDRPGIAFLAVTLALHMPDGTAERLVKIPPDTSEIGQVHFLREPAIRKIRNLRHGVPAWLGHLSHAGMLSPKPIGNLISLQRDPADNFLHDTDKRGQVIINPQPLLA